MDPATFAHALGDRFSWWVTAKTLREAAERLFATIPHDQLAPDLDLLLLGEGDWQHQNPVTGPKNVYVFLAGLSMENLIKGELARLHPNSISKGELPRMFLNHDLVMLATIGNISLSSSEQRVFKVASEAVISWGRYPGGNRYDRGHIAPPDDLDVRAFKKTFDAVFDRLEIQVMEGMEDDGQWNS